MLSKKITFVFLALFAIGAGVRGQSAVHINHYRFAIELNDTNDTILGEAGISFSAVQAGQTIVLDLANVNAKGKGMKVLAVTDNRQRPLNFQHEKNLLQVNLAEQLAARDTTTIFISPFLKAPSISDAECKTCATSKYRLLSISAINDNDALSRA